MRFKTARQSWKARLAGLKEQRGFSLVEVLGAVTIISIISVTMMSYFIAGLNQSADESRRIIAANLARMKAAEIKESLAPYAAYEPFARVLSPGVNRFVSDAELPAGYRNRMLLEPDQINGSSYRYILTFNSTVDTRGKQLDDLMSFSPPSEYLRGMSITVSWDNQSVPVPLPAKSTTIDTYLVRSE